MGTLGTVTAEVLAHAGGWDELLIVLAPLVLVAGLLWAANRRAKRLLTEQQAAAAAAEPAPSAGTGPNDEPASPAAKDPTGDRVPAPGTGPAEEPPPLRAP
jgi:hypothetical protein